MTSSLSVSGRIHLLGTFTGLVEKVVAQEHKLQNVVNQITSIESTLAGMKLNTESSQPAFAGNSSGGNQQVQCDFKDLQEMSNRAGIGSAASVESKFSSLEGRIKLLETDYRQLVLEQPFRLQADSQAGGISMSRADIDARLKEIEEAVSLSDDGVLATWLKQHLAVGGSKPGVAAEAKQQVDFEAPLDSTDHAQADIAADKTAAEESTVLPLEHSIQESVWEAAVLLGLPEIGFGSSFCLFVTTLLNLLVQGYMCYVLITSPEFNGSYKLSEEVPVMNEWRNVDGHLDTYTNMFDANLVSRVCALDSSLSLASSQMDLVDDINSYLSLELAELELSYSLPMGPLLCMLCLSVFVTMMVREFRELAVFLVCLIVLPHNLTQIKDNVLMAISHKRLVALFALSIFRFCISATLLYNGAMWLSSTKSIGDLILNAAALGFMIDIDELFFATLVPLRLPCYVQRLEPLSCSQPRFEIDTVMCFVILCCVLVVAYITKVGPAVDDMLKVKTALCGGSLEFIVARGIHGYNVARLPEASMGLDTADVRDKATRSAEELRSNPRMINGTYYFLQMMQFSDVLPQYSLWCKTDTTCLEVMAQGDIGFIANYVNPACRDLDSSSTPGLQVLFRAAYEYWKKGGTYSGVPSQPCGTCAPPEPLLPFHCPSYRHLCGESARNAMVRVLCPATCGCNSATSGLYLAGSIAGCPLSCEAIAFEALASRGCEDAEVTGTALLKPAWERYWNDFRFTETVLGNIPYESGMADKMISGGCDALSGLTKSMFWNPCETTDSMKSVGRIPVLAFCPRTCCNASRSNCLASCNTAQNLLE